MEHIIHFNPQGPHGPRQCCVALYSMRKIFQSTRPSRASTLPAAGQHGLIWYFNPQGPHGPRPPVLSPSPIFSLFQSTRPSRASTFDQYFLLVRKVISIHKALTGLDAYPAHHVARQNHFNPQGPHGPRQVCRQTCICITIFQSTRPSRASTQNY